MDVENKIENAAENPMPPSGGAVTESPPKQTNFDEQNAELEKRRQEMEEQDKKLLAALDEVLEKRRVREEEKHTSVQRLAKNIVKKGVGFVSLGLVLMFLGIVMICCLFSPTPDFLLPLKLSPICAVLIGLEILFNQIVTNGNFKIHLPSIIISAALTIGCCAMCAALNTSLNQRKEEFNNRSIAAEIYDRSYKELRYIADIASIEVEVDLNPDGSGKTKGLEALSPDDYVNITVDFAGIINSPREFTANCKKIIDGYRIMGINVTNYHFKNNSLLHSFTLDVEGKYAQDFSESRLEDLVNHIYLEDMSYLKDLEDYVEESSDQT